MKIFGREPVRWIGIIVSLILAVVTTLLGQGVISDALAGQVTDVVKAAENLLLLLAPVIATELARTQATPVVAPQLPEGSFIQVTDSRTGAAKGIAKL